MRVGAAAAGGSSNRMNRRAFVTGLAAVLAVPIGAYLTNSTPQNGNLPLVARLRTHLTCMRAQRLRALKQLNPGVDWGSRYSRTAPVGPWQRLPDLTTYLPRVGDHSPLFARVRASGRLAARVGPAERRRAGGVSPIGRINGRHRASPPPTSGESCRWRYRLPADIFSQRVNTGRSQFEPASASRSLRASHICCRASSMSRRDA